ncbi:S8 family serine peptidase [Amycolatopsis sp. QT-25]|uniref:S8 family serine peptidase n=1 Tax=Amycolatopsis sp. QT-25 TaxID=3034022 RepID=UPI0023EB31BC|nr:S8 family serine peptidase [Amycolatopsis sp. QT-25]WET77564.1 S8 family serine peptidase [Amycolatopsis sp. QT-25]
MVRFAGKTAVAGCVAFMASLGIGVPATAVAEQCANPTGTYTAAVSWGQRLIDPVRIWPLSRGAGQLVAVIGTGVDGGNGQFAPGQLVGGQGTTADDCDGRGTIAAGIVGAQPDPSTTFTGIAPGAKILPIRYTQVNGGGDPGQLASAIETALNRGAGIVLIAVPAAADSPALTGAVSRAREKGALVISPAAGTQQAQTSYPTATPGVLAVGSTNRTGAAVQSESGSYVGISAPGAELVSTSAGAGGTVAHRWPVSDPSLAAAHVAGVAALVRAYHPALSPEQVVARLTLTAHRGPGGGHDPRRGWGAIDAYAAVSASIPAGTPGPGGPPSVAPDTFVVPAAAPARANADKVSGVLAIAGVAAAIAAGVVVAAIRRGKRRGWKPSRFRAS